MTLPTMPLADTRSSQIGNPMICCDVPRLRIRVRIVGRDKLDALARVHADARAWIEAWIADVESAQWRTPQDIKARYASASFLSGNVVIFNVKGNRYRLETLVGYASGIVEVRWAGTHGEYDQR